MYFFKDGTFSQPNGLFRNNGLHGIAEEEKYQCIDKMLFSIPGYVDRKKGYENDPTLTKVNTLYYEHLGGLGSVSRLRGIMMNGKHG